MKTLKELGVIDKIEIADLATLQFVAAQIAQQKAAGPPQHLLAGGTDIERLCRVYGWWATLDQLASAVQARMLRLISEAEQYDA